MNNVSIWLKGGALILLVFFLFTGQVAAKEAGGVDFAERYSQDQSELQLTGTAVLTWALLFDVYAGAFYLPADVSSREWTEEVPKRLEIAYLRSFKAEDFSSSSDKLLRENLASADYQALADRLQHFYRLFRDIEPGDRYSLTYKPEIGTELRLNDQLLGAVPGADFAVAYFGLWLGPKPISESFRDRLLGAG